MSDLWPPASSRVAWFLASSLVGRSIVCFIGLIAPVKIAAWQEGDPVRWILFFRMMCMLIIFVPSDIKAKWNQMKEQHFRTCHHDKQSNLYSVPRQWECQTWAWQFLHLAGLETFSGNTDIYISHTDVSLPQPQETHMSKGAENLWNNHRLLDLLYTHKHMQAHIWQQRKHFSCERRIWVSSLWPKSYWRTVRALDKMSVAHRHTPGR